MISLFLAKINSSAASFSCLCGMPVFNRGIKNLNFNIGMVLWNTPWISMVRGLQKLWIFFQPTAPTFPARTLIGRLQCCHRGCYGPSPFPSLSFAIKVRAWKGKESNHQRHLSKVGIIFSFENNIILTTILFFYWCFNFQSNLASSVIVFIRNLSYLGDLLWLPQFKIRYRKLRDRKSWLALYNGYKIYLKFGIGLQQTC